MDKGTEVQSQKQTDLKISRAETLRCRGKDIHLIHEGRAGLVEFYCIVNYFLQLADSAPLQEKKKTQFPHNSV